MPLLDPLTDRPRMRRLLGGWRDIQDDIRALAAGLDGVPEQCECHDSREHLRGTCTCCQAHEGQSRAHCADCEILLHTIELKLDTLVTDTLRFLPAIMSLSTRKLAEGERRRVTNLRRQVEMVPRVFGRLRSTAAEYQAQCSAARLHALKQHAHGLWRNGQMINEILEDKIG